MAESLREKIVETNRDVKWICRTLKRMEEKDAEVEERLRSLENWRSEAAGEEKRERQIAAGPGFLAACREEPLR